MPRRPLPCGVCPTLPKNWSVVSVCYANKCAALTIGCRLISKYTSVTCRRYDFALPLLVLHAFEFQSATNLKHWLSVCPRRQITVLDTHDGMGIDDITGLANVRRAVLMHRATAMPCLH